MHFEYQVGQFRLLRCLLPEDGPGSLNRFFLGQKRVYETFPETPTKANPPKFYVVRFGDLDLVFGKGDLGLVFGKKGWGF